MADDYAGNTSTDGTVTVGGSRSGRIELAGDTDWFRITLTAGVTYQFDLKGNPTGDGTLPDPFLRLRNGAGSSLRFDDDSGAGLNSRISSFTATVSGTYFLSVGSSTTSGTGTYRLSATQTSGPTPADDYLAGTATSGTVSIGGSRSGTIETAGDTDWFRITLTAGAVYRFDLKGSRTDDGTLSDPFLRLRDSAGNSITFDDDSGTGLNSSIAGFIAPASGTYYLSVGSSALGGVGTYRVSATQTSAPPAADDYSANSSTGGTISSGGSSTGVIESSGDTDWFRTTLVAGRTYQVDVEGSPTGQGTLADAYGSIRNAAGIKVAEADDGGSGFNTRFTYTVPAGGGGRHPRRRGSCSASLPRRATGRSPVPARTAPGR